MSKISTQPYKGTRDFYPQDFRLREYIFGKWREVCQSFGYEEYEASVIEPLELYTAKTSEEIVKEQTFSFQDRGGRDVTLRPEMTPSVSRMVAARRMELGFPLRLFSIPNCFRYERMQRGRTREFWQLNADLFGVSSVQADIEIILLANSIMKSFGADKRDYKILINSKIAFGIMLKSIGFKTPVMQKKAMQIIDRFHKQSRKDTKVELTSIGIGDTDIEDFFELFDRGFAEAQRDLFESNKLTDSDSYSARKAIENLLEIKQVLDKHGVEVEFDNITRGFDYYTDVVFEVFDVKPENSRSLFGGGRYDGLVGMFGVEPVPTVGFGMGDVTMQNFLESHGLIPELSTKNDIYLMVSDDQFEQAQEYAEQQRKTGKNVAVDLSGKKIDKQFKTAKKLGFSSDKIIKFPINSEVD